MKTMRSTKARTARSGGMIEGPQLCLFSPWDQRVGQKFYLAGLRPGVGHLTQGCFMWGLNLDFAFSANPAYDPTRLRAITHSSIHYVQAINPDTREALIHSPLLSHAPWCKDEWHLIDALDLAPVTKWGFNESEFRTINLEKSCPFPILWGACRDAYNRR